jgi:hypothetical protein
MRMVWRTVLRSVTGAVTITSATAQRSNIELALETIGAITPGYTDSECDSPETLAHIDAGRRGFLTEQSLITPSAFLGGTFAC